MSTGDTSPSPRITRRAYTESLTPLALELKENCCGSLLGTEEKSALVTAICNLEEENIRLRKELNQLNLYVTTHINKQSK